MNFTDTNNSVNGSSSPMYVFAPVKFYIKSIIAGAYVIAGTYGTVANCLILYYLGTRRRYESRFLAFSRRSVSDTFIKSLALSDVLSCIISLPAFISEMFADYLETDLQCKISRFLILFFPVVTITNYFVIGIEKYMSVFHPFNIPKRHVYRRAVIASWIVGLLITCIAMPAYNLTRFELDQTTYTHVCKYDKSVKSKRRAFMIFIIIGYVIPSVILTALHFRLFRFLRRLRRVGPNQNNNNSSRAHQNAMQRHKIISLFISLTFAFILPYIVWIAYGVVVMALDLKVSFTVDYISRYIGGFLVYANAVSGSTILFVNHAYLRKRLKELAGRISEHFTF